MNEQNQAKSTTNAGEESIKNDAKNGEKESSGEKNAGKNKPAKATRKTKSTPAEPEEKVDEIQKQRGRDIRNWRLQQGFTVKHLAKRLGISTNTLRSWEDGAFLNWARLNALVNIGFPSDKAFPPL